MKANKEHFPDFVGWERGYCALTYSESDKNRIVRYIKNQKEHHRKRKVREELITILKANKVEFDERYV